MTARTLRWRDDAPWWLDVAAYGERLQRLTALKDRYDPANLFRMNANIPPTARRDQALVR